MARPGELARAFPLTVTQLKSRRETSEIAGNVYADQVLAVSSLMQIAARTSVSTPARATPTPLVFGSLEPPWSLAADSSPPSECSSEAELVVVTAAASGVLAGVVAGAMVVVVSPPAAPAVVVVVVDAPALAVVVVDAPWAVVAVVPPAGAVLVVAAAVVGVEAAPVTFTTPVMNGCGVQMYENSPGVEKVNLNSFPLARALESKAPLSAVAVCSRSPSLRQVTVEPTGTVISAGVNFQVLVSPGGILVDLHRGCRRPGPGSLRGAPRLQTAAR